MHWPFISFSHLNLSSLSDKSFAEAFSFQTSNLIQQSVTKTQKQVKIQIEDKNISKEKLINLTRVDLENAGQANHKKLWSEEEDKLLKQLVKKHNMEWNEISKFLPQRNPKMCYSRHRRLENSTKNYWKKSQQQKILSLIEKFGQDWTILSEHLKKRTPKQIKEHYQNYLRPDINKTEWDIEDDIFLINLINTNGLNWKLIKDQMKGRTQNQIKNRYFGRIVKLQTQKIQRELGKEAELQTIQQKVNQKQQSFTKYKQGLKQQKTINYPLIETIFIIPQRQ